MKFVIITGLSGAGKTLAVRTMEDMGYYCVDNMPPALIPKFAEFCIGTHGQFDKIALVCDIRGGTSFGELISGLDDLEGSEYDILFLEANDSTLVARYKESRRRHPLEEEGLSLVDAIDTERKLLRDMRNRATAVIDTTGKKQQELRREITSIFDPTAAQNGMAVQILTFGFKYGIPLDSDLVFDVRFLPNPFYIADLKELTGKDQPIVDYVMSFEQTGVVMDKLFDLIDYTIPHYVEEGKSKLVISIGCTGGRHRSVAIAEALHKYLKSKSQFATISHRDCGK